MLYLSADDLRKALPMDEAIDAMRHAFIELSSGGVTLPLRQHVAAPGAPGIALVMTCHSAARRQFILKFLTLFGGNPARGLPLIQAQVILSDGETGAHLAVMDGGALTALRTGAASGAATDALARRDASLAAVFGAGVQARTQLEAVCAVRAIRRARVYDANPDAAERFAVAMGRRLGIPVERAADPAAALDGAEIVCTATTASAPVFDDGALAPGAHLNAVGAFKPDMAEIPPATVARARIVVDHRASALEEAGDLLGPLREGLIRDADLGVELGDVLAGQAPGRASEGEITLFKSVGVAVQDLYAAACALENARRMNLGITLPARTV